jgi:uncharacterized membrane protein
MMKGLAHFLVFVIATTVGHVFVIQQAPQAIMMRAMAGAMKSGAQINTLRHAPRPKPTPPDAPVETRGIVRPSPDLAYSLCVFDLSNGPVRVTAAPWEDYVSLSLYAANTDNFWARNDRQAGGKAIGIVLAAKGDGRPTPAGVERVESPSAKGMALIRRLAPNDEVFAQVEGARKGDVCAPL